MQLCGLSFFAYIVYALECQIHSDVTGEGPIQTIALHGSQQWAGKRTVRIDCLPKSCPGNAAKQFAYCSFNTPTTSYNGQVIKFATAVTYNGDAGCYWVPAAGAGNSFKTLDTSRYC